MQKGENCPFQLCPSIHTFHRSKKSGTWVEGHHHSPHLGLQALISSHILSLDMGLLYSSGDPACSWLSTCWFYPVGDHLDWRWNSGRLLLPCLETVGLNRKSIYFFYFMKVFITPIFSHALYFSDISAILYLTYNPLSQQQSFYSWKCELRLWAFGKSLL